MAYTNNAKADTGMIGRQDKILTLGVSNTATKDTFTACGYDASHTDGAVLDMKDADLEGFSFRFKVDTAPDGTGTVTAHMAIRVSDDKSNWTIVAVSPEIGAASLTAGTEINVPYPRGAAQGRYVQAGIVATGTTVTAGKVTCVVDTFAGV